MTIQTFDQRAQAVCELKHRLYCFRYSRINDVPDKCSDGVLTWRFTALIANCTSGNLLALRMHLQGSLIPTEYVIPVVCVKIGKGM